MTNPRNHYGAPAPFGIAEAGGAFSQWPGTLGLAATRDAALAQRKSIVLLKNACNLLPLKQGVRMYIEEIDAAVAAQHGYVKTQNPEDAHICIPRVTSGRRGIGPLGSSGETPIDLTLPEARLMHIRSIMQKISAEPLLKSRCGG